MGVPKVSAKDDQMVVPGQSALDIGYRDNSILKDSLRQKNMHSLICMWEFLWIFDLDRLVTKRKRDEGLNSLEGRLVTKFF